MLLNKTYTPSRETAIYSLAVVGFIALVSLGIALAVYSSRFVPNAMTSIGTAAVSLSQWFNSSEEAPLSVVPTSTIIYFGGATTTKPSTSTPVKTVPAVKPGPKTDVVYQVSVATGTPILSGLPDLIVTIDDVGYLASTTKESFIATSTVPAGSRSAVKFTVKNIGTNIAQPWRLSASIPTRFTSVHQWQPLPSINPGDSLSYMIYFDQASGGTDQMISITANFDRAIAESNTDNNSASTKVTILGS